MSTPERKAGDSLQGSGQSNRPCVERCELNRGEASVNPEKDLLRSSASPRLSSEAWEARNMGLFGQPPYAIERGTGDDCRVFVMGIRDHGEALKIAAALNDPENDIWWERVDG